MPTAAQLIQRYARQYNVGPWAAMAVAMSEGGLRNRRGDIGDLAGGGSYGPFQLYARGALPARFRGNPQAADRWAWSPQGIEYAIRAMANTGAAGLRGKEAIRHIVTEFERPENPQAQIAKATQYWQGMSRTGAMPVAAGPTRASYWAYDPKDISSANNKQAALSLLGIHPVLAAAVGKKIYGGVTPRRYDMNFPGAEGAEGAQLMLALIKMAQRMGLRAGENPYSDPVQPVHTEGSYHYQRFPGRYNGRLLGRGLDVTGPNLQMFLNRVLRRFGRSPFEEIFYDPWGQWDAGRFSRQGIGGHGTHVHFSV